MLSVRVYSSLILCQKQLQGCINSCITCYCYRFKCISGKQYKCDTGMLPGRTVLPSWQELASVFAPQWIWTLCSLHLWCMNHFSWLCIASFMYPNSNDKLCCLSVVFKWWWARIIQARPVILDYGSSLFMLDSSLKGKKLTPPRYRMDESIRICVYHVFPLIPC